MAQRLRHNVCVRLWFSRTRASRLAGQLVPGTKQEVASDMSREGLTGDGPVEDEGLVGRGPTDAEGLTGEGPSDTEGLTGSGSEGEGERDAQGLTGTSSREERSSSPAPSENWVDNPAEERRGNYSVDQSSIVNTTPYDIGPNITHEQDDVQVVHDPIRGGVLSAGSKQPVPPEESLRGAYGGTGGDETPPTTPDYPPADDASDVNDIPLNP